VCGFGSPSPGTLIAWRAHPTAIRTRGFAAVDRDARPLDRTAAFARYAALAWSVGAFRYTTFVPDAVHELLATEVALDKLAARGIAREEVEQLLRHRYVLVANLRGDPLRPQRRNRRILIGTTYGGRVLTLVIEATLDPTTWLLVTGWESTAAERTMMKSR
jgi:hypothetical protein